MFQRRDSQIIAKDKNHSRPVYLHWIIMALLLFSFIMISLSINNKSATYDEPQHYRYGLQILLEHNSDRFDDSKMPISVINGLPRATALVLQSVFNLKQPPTFLYRMNTGRYMTIIVFILLCLYVYRWSSSIYGWRGGLLSLFLTIFSPNLMAHSRLITTDIFATTSITISMYYFWKMFNEPRIGSAMKSGLALGVAQITKYTSIFLFPIMLLIVFAKIIANAQKRTEGNCWKERINRLFQYSGISLIHILMVILVINIGFLSNRTGTLLNDYQFQSNLFQKIQSETGHIAKIPIPLPYPYLQGLDLVKYVDSHLSNNTILLDEVKVPPEKFKNYYLTAFIFKVPIAMQIMFCWALFILIWKWRNIKFLKNEIFILLPIVILFMYFNFFMNTQIGIRFALPLMPFIYIFTGIVLSDHKRGKRMIPLFVLCMYLCVSVGTWYPHYISYFNEFVPNRKMSYKILADSNIDFGQNEYFLKDFKKKYPDAIYQPKFPIAGKVVVGTNFVNPVFQNNNYHWLRDNFKPIDHICYSHLVFDLSLQDVEKLNFSQVGYFINPESLIYTTENNYYRLNNWQGAGLEYVDEHLEAELHYKKNIAFAPNEAEPHFSLARVYENLGDSAKSKNHYEKALHLLRLEDIYQKGLVELREKKYEEAIIRFDDVIKQQPTFRQVLFYKGLVLQLQGLHNEAIPYYSEYLNVVPEYFQAHFNLGYAFLKIGRLQDAIIHFENTLAVKPDYEEANNHLVWCREKILNTLSFDISTN